MSTVALVSKKPAGGIGNFNYEYTCTCTDGTNKPNITITSANDNEARMLAQLQCDDYCGTGLGPKLTISQIAVTDRINHPCRISCSNNHNSNSRSNL
jgi:hypothetical protein